MISPTIQKKKKYWYFADNFFHERWSGRLVCVQTTASRLFVVSLSFINLFKWTKCEHMEILYDIYDMASDTIRRRRKKIYNNIMHRVSSTWSAVGQQICPYLKMFVPPFCLFICFSYTSSLSHFPFDCALLSLP